LLRARVRPGEEARLRAFVRDEAVAHALQVPGLLSLQPALRPAGDRVELVIVTTWKGFGDLTAASPDLDGPLAMPGAAPMIEESRAEHFELVLGDARAMPLREARLRLTRIPIRPGYEASYYRAVRAWSDRLLDEAGMVAFTLGRRVARRRDEIVAVQVWQDEAALREAAGADLDRPMGAEELSHFWAADPTIEHFDALTATDPRPNAPAILVADDQRRYVHATPAAARLTGHSLARLLTMRVDDVTPPSVRAAVPDAWDRFVVEGSVHGPFALVRPDGSQVDIEYRAKANTPWPGAHASLLVPAADRLGQAGALDVDAALVDAGLVARYVPVAAATA
jgi:PAS domain-containing protein